MLQSPYYKHSNVLSFLLCSFSVTRYFQRRLPVFQLNTFLQVVVCIGFVVLCITVDIHRLSHNMYLSNMWNINILCYYSNSHCGQTLGKYPFYPEWHLVIVDNCRASRGYLAKLRRLTVCAYAANITQSKCAHTHVPIATSRIVVVNHRSITSYIILYIR